VTESDTAKAVPEKSRSPATNVATENQLETEAREEAEGRPEDF
jgi:hypothetical protein